MTSIYRAVVELEQSGEAGALCTIVESTGSTPRHKGSKMLVYEDGHTIGSVGGGEVEYRVIQEAIQAVLDGKTRVLNYNMVDPKQGDPGVCGGSLEVYVEPILPKPTLLVIGGGHVGKALAHLAKWLQFRVVVSDDRTEFSNPESNPDADEYYPIKMAELPQHMKINRYTYVVLTTRGSNVDVEGLPALLQCQAAYIGIIGSKRRWITTRKALMAQGINEDELNKIYSPIGLELNVETPEEIAVSIMAEVLKVRHGGSGESMKL